MNLNVHKAKGEEKVSLPQFANRPKMFESDKKLHMSLKCNL
jgi:hypothetical protein